MNVTEKLIERTQDSARPLTSIDAELILENARAKARAFRVDVPGGLAILCPFCGESMAQPEPVCPHCEEELTGGCGCG